MSCTCSVVKLIKYPIYKCGLLSYSVVHSLWFIVYFVAMVGFEACPDHKIVNNGSPELFEVCSSTFSGTLYRFEMAICALGNPLITESLFQKCIKIDPIGTIMVPY